MASSADNSRKEVRLDDELDETKEVDLSSLLDRQDHRVESESKQSTKVILVSCGCLLLVFLVWYALSSSARREVDGLIQNVKESRQDLDTETTRNEMASAYDEIMDKLGSRSAGIDSATRSLGVDPLTVKEDGMDAEMKEMMGGEGRTSGERQRIVEKLAKMTGTELRKPPAPTKEVKVPTKQPAESEEVPIPDPDLEK